MFRSLLIATILISTTSIFANSAKSNVDIYLEGRIPKNNHRYDSFKLALLLMNNGDINTIVETGTARKGVLWCETDGCSTIIFSHWANRNNAILYSVDIDANSLQVAKETVGAYANNVHFVQSDSVFFLSNFNQPIDFLYLDSFDYEFNNPLPSQLHHLHEIEAAYPWLHDNSIVMIDDCDLPGGGKGKLVIEFLLNKGWRIIFSKYQVIFTK